MRDNSGIEAGTYCSKRNGSTGKYCVEGPLTEVAVLRRIRGRVDGEEVKLRYFYCPYHLERHQQWVNAPRVKPAKRVE